MDATRNQPERMTLQVGGLISSTYTFVDWTHRHLKDKDEIRMVVCEKNKVSKPKKSRTELEKDRKKSKLKYLKVLSKELGYEIKRKKV